MVKKDARQLFFCRGSRIKNMLAHGVCAFSNRLTALPGHGYFAGAATLWPALGGRVNLVSGK